MGIKELIDVFGPVITFIFATLGIIEHIRAIRERKRAPDTRKWEAFHGRMDAADQKLSRDYQKINELEEDRAKNIQFRRVVLKSIKAILSHLSEGNHTGAMKEVANDIDLFLIDS